MTTAVMNTEQTTEVPIPEKHITEEFRVAFVEEVLAAHNTCRRLHGVPDLETDPRLTKQSQECAEDLLITENIRSSRFPTVGENVYVISTNDPYYIPKGENPVKEWYQQRTQHKVGEEPTNNSSVNYTQLVWKMTQFLGVGIARNDSKIVIVCQYSPPGNIYGEYSSNVLPEIGGASELGDAEPTDKSIADAE